MTTLTQAERMRARAELEDCERVLSDDGLSQRELAKIERRLEAVAELLAGDIVTRDLEALGFVVSDDPR